MQKDRIRQGRLSDDRSEDVISYLSSMDADHWIADADLLVDMAHLLMLRRQGIIDGEPARTLMALLLDIQEQGMPAQVFDDRYEDIHAGKEAYLIEKAGIDHGGRLHMGRSRNDEVATCIRLRLRDEMIACMDALIRLRRVLIRVASEHTGTVMPGFTHLQHAQPTTLAHHLLAHEQAFSRDCGRFRDAYTRINRCPLGSAAFASTGYPIDREYAADLLGFDGVVLNTMDAVSARDFALEAIAGCSISMLNASRVCEELVIWSSSFVKFVNLTDAHTSTSSIMPQKKNPDTAEVMRAKAGTVTGALAAAMMIMKGLPMSYNRDLQELTPHLWRAVSEYRKSAALLADMLSKAEFNRERMELEAGAEFSTATELADMLVREHGIPFRTAHNIVGRGVRSGRLDIESLEEAGEEMAGISLRSQGLTSEKISAALDVRRGIAMRGATGGPAAAAVEEMLDHCRADLDNDREWLEMEKCRLSEAITHLHSEARRLVQ